MTEGIHHISEARSKRKPKKAAQKDPRTMTTEELIAALEGTDNA